MVDDNHLLNHNVPIALIRGGLGERYYWDYFKQIVEKRLNRQVLFLDIAVFFPFEKNIDVVEMVDHFRQQLFEHTHQYHCHLLGLSFAAAIVLRWQDLFSDEVISASLINPVLLDRQYRWHVKSLLYLLKVVWMSVCPGNTRQRWFNMHSAWPSLHDQLPESRELSDSFSQLISLFKILFKEPSILKPHVPIQLLVSRHDRLANHQVSYSLAESWKLPLFPHLSAGHDIALDDPRWVCEKLTDWVTRND
ncbi:MAG: hypothetical protein CENE_01420 [Candidatus Celerinatantimonas neptuna]|nr:MAG: hypothetical protein CENE_01420 [Candidatus Celerinatantimonas neptuna]